MSGGSGVIFYYQVSKVNMDRWSLRYTMLYVQIEHNSCAHFFRIDRRDVKQMIVKVVAINTKSGILLLNRRNCITFEIVAN